MLRIASATTRHDDVDYFTEVNHTAHSSYLIYFGHNVLTAMAPAMVRGRATLVVTTPTVFAMYGDTLIQGSAGLLNTQDFLVLDCVETRKDLRQVEKVCERALGTLDRGGLIVGFGGGVVMDIACFAASMIRRGIGYTKIPTTLLGQVDAGIGIKGGVNFSNKKSFVGTFYAPEQVLIQPSFLATVPRSHLAAGFAEMLKMAIIVDAALFTALERYGVSFVNSGFAVPAVEASNAIIRSIHLMIEELRPDLTERISYRRSVDFGHTFGPALEAASGFELHHGYAVAIDMALSAALAVELGVLSPADMDRIISCMAAVDLPIWHDALTADFCRRAMQDAEHHRNGNMNLVVPTGVGSHAFVQSADEIAEGSLQASLLRLRNASQKTRPEVQTRQAS